jgi:hypothetical protein
MADETTTTAPLQETPAPQAPAASSVPPMETMPHEAAGSSRSRLLPILGVLIVLLVIALGGLYLWGSMLTKAPADAPAVAAEDQAASMDGQNGAGSAPQAAAGTEESYDSLDADIDAASYDSMDADLGSVDSEIDTGVAGQ